MIDIYVNIPKHKVQEGSSFTATAYFRLIDASTVPTTARYRIDCSTTGDAVRAWTDLTPAASIEIAITPADNAIISNTGLDERKQLTVETDTGLDTQRRERVFYNVSNIHEY